MAQLHLILLSLKTAQVGNDRRVPTLLVAPDLSSVLPQILVDGFVILRFVSDLHIAVWVTHDEEGPTFALCIPLVVCIVAYKQSDVLQPVLFTVDLIVIPLSEDGVDEKYGVLEKGLA